MQLICDDLFLLLYCLIHRLYRFILNNIPTLRTDHIMCVFKKNVGPNLELVDLTFECSLKLDQWESELLAIYVIIIFHFFHNHC